VPGAASAPGTGRTNVLQGAVHLVIFAAFLLLAVVP
jgi:Ca2+:H+ antiporter